MYNFIKKNNYLPDNLFSFLLETKLFDLFTFRCDRLFTSRKKVEALSGIRIKGFRDGVTTYDVGVANIFNYYIITI